MKNFLSKLWSLSRTDRVRTLAIDAVSLPSFCRVNMLKLVSVFALLLTIGVGNAWGANQTYTLVSQSNLSSLSSTDKVLIVSSNGSSSYFAANNAEKTSVGNLSETSVTITSNTITADLDADYTWYLEFKSNQTINGNSYPTFYIKSTKGTYYLQNAGGTGCFVTSKDATDNNNVWAVGYQGSYTNKNGTYYVTGLYNMGQTRMLAHYSSDWRCYASTNYSNVDGRVVQIYKQESSCTNNVTPAEGTKTNVSAMTFSSESVATCSETAADRQVTVTITPASCYTVPSSTRLTPTGTSAGYVSGPTDNGNGTYSFVYQFAQNATGTSTFSASLSTKTTYTVQYNAGATTCTGGNAITGSHDNDTKTCGTNLTLPGETFHTTGYTQTGWTKTSCGTKTNNLGGSYTSDAAQTFYPVWTVNSYTVTWMVNGEEYTAGGSTSVNYGSHVETLPTAPTPSCGDKFMGWTTTNIGSVGQATDAGLNLFTTAGGAPTISAEGDVTYYAVFADYDE